MSNSASRIDESSDQPVSISGTAENAKAGAVLVTSDGRTIFVDGMEAWDDDVRDTKLTLVGRLHRKKIYPDIKVEGGLTSQGASGTPWVLVLTEPFKAE